MATLREIQLVELEIMNEIDAICTKHGINYSMGWGTLLGAIRHEGFIPWDDDMDIYMRIEDTELLKKYIDGDRYFFQDNSTDIRTNFTFIKVRKNNTYMPQKMFIGMDIHQGIWIDVFPLYPAAKTVSGRRLQYFISLLWQSYRSRYINVKKGYTKRIIFHLLCIIPASIQRVIDRVIEKIVILLGSSRSEFFFSPLNNTFEKSFIPQKTLDTKRYKFEDAWLLGPVDYDTYLRQIFGDSYMTPVRYGHDVDYSKVII